MKPTRLLLLVAVLSAPQAALAETADGSGALALAALAGENSPLVTPAAKELLAKFLDGEPKASFPAGQTIAVKVDKLTCKASNVDITLHSCELVFGSRTATLTGRRRMNCSPRSPRSACRPMPGPALSSKPSPSLTVRSIPMR